MHWNQYTVDLYYQFVVLEELATDRLIVAGLLSTTPCTPLHQDYRTSTGLSQEILMSGATHKLLQQQDKVGIRFDGMKTTIQNQLNQSTHANNKPFLYGYCCRRSNIATLYNIQYV